MSIRKLTLSLYHSILIRSLMDSKEHCIWNSESSAALLLHKRFERFFAMNANGSQVTCSTPSVVFPSSPRWLSSLFLWWIAITGRHDERMRRKNTCGSYRWCINWLLGGSTSRKIEFFFYSRQLIVN